MRYSPLSQINTSNVTRLVEVWSYSMKPAVTVLAGHADGTEDAHAAQEAAQRAADGGSRVPRRRSRLGSSEATPLVVEGLMYLPTPYGRVVALEPETGREVWSYEVPGTAAQPSLRGVEYWPGDGHTAPRIFCGTRDGRLIGLEAKTGQPAQGFGSDGIVELKTPDVIPASLANASAGTQYGLTSPPLVFRNLVITGAAVQEFPELGPAGDVRAWDARTGKLVWTFHTVPRPGEFGHDTWKGDSWRDRSGTNVWGFMTADVEHGIVYLPVAAPTWDRFGGDRVGANLFGSTIVAVDANSGKRIWHFQVVHHDIWDFDTEAPPALIDIRRGKHTLPAVAIVSKSGYFFLLNRLTGKPILPVREQKVPASDVPGEVASPTQPFPVKTPPFARQTFSLADVATVTPQLEEYCRDWIQSRKMRMGGPYLPLALDRLTISFPGRQGGANWGGGSYDPVRGYFFVNANNLGQVEQISRREDGTLTTFGPDSGRFSDREHGLMCQQPPWGTLTAINVATGEIAWQSTLGVSDQLPENVAHTGRPNVGGSIATAGGLVFIGATDDARFRAFNAQTGKEVWTVKLAAAAHATPMTYLGKDGKQYVAIVATGGSFLESPITGDSVDVFALP
jgi:quinoprotein glucose dehydrogenase